MHNACDTTDISSVWHKCTHEYRHIHDAAADHTSQIYTMGFAQNCQSCPGHEEEGKKVGDEVSSWQNEAPLSCGDSSAQN